MAASRLRDEIRALKEEEGTASPYKDMLDVCARAVVHDGAGSVISVFIDELAMYADIDTIVNAVAPQRDVSAVTTHMRFLVVTAGLAAHAVQTYDFDTFVKFAQDDNTIITMMHNDQIMHMEDNTGEPIPGNDGLRAHVSSTERDDDLAAALWNMLLRMVSNGNDPAFANVKLHPSPAEVNRNAAAYPIMTRRVYGVGLVAREQVEEGGGGAY